MTTETHQSARKGQLVRIPEVAMWASCLDEALIDARRLAGGDPLDTPSKDRRRLRWQMIWDVADMHEWLASHDEGGLLWIESVVHSCLGQDSFDIARLRREVQACLAKAEGVIEGLTREVIAHAVGRAETVQDRHVPRPHEGEAWLLPCSSRPRSRTVDPRRQRTGRKAVATHKGADSQTRFAFVSV